MTTAYYIYSKDVDGRLNLYYTLNSISSHIFTTTNTHIRKDYLEEILTDLKIDVDSDRVTYLGSFNLDKFSKEEFDAIAIDVSSIDMKNLMLKWDLKENPSHHLGRDENVILLALFAKLLLEKTKKYSVESK